MHEQQPQKQTRSQCLYFVNLTYVQILEFLSLVSFCVILASNPCMAPSEVNVICSLPCWHQLYNFLLKGGQKIIQDQYFSSGVCLSPAE